jgi:hypothetical protein
MVSKDDELDTPGSTVVGDGAGNEVNEGREGLEDTADVTSTGEEIIVPNSLVERGVCVVARPVEKVGAEEELDCVLVTSS